MIWRYATMVFGGAFAGLFGMWAGDRIPPIRIESVTVLTDSVPPGGELRIRYVVSRDRPCNTRVQKMISDSTGKFETSDEQDILSVLRPLGNDAYISSSIIPKNFATGRANYRSARKYECNPLHVLWPITVLVADAHFQIEGPVANEPIEVIPRK